MIPLPFRLAQENARLIASRHPYRNVSPSQMLSAQFHRRVRGWRARMIFTNPTPTTEPKRK